MPPPTDITNRPMPAAPPPPLGLALSASAASGSPKPKSAIRVWKDRQASGNACVNIATWSAIWPPNTDMMPTSNPSFANG